MAEVFPNPPITEGLVDIRVQLPGEVSLADLEILHDKIKDSYPEKKSRKKLEATFDPKDEKEPLKAVPFATDGFIFGTSDGRQLAQYRLDGFTFNRLRPYSRWEEVFPEAKKLWEIYRTAVQPVLVTRLAVRYINTIEIPSKAIDYDHYLTAAPKVPEGLPQLLQSFLTRIEVPFPDRDVVAIITQTPSGKQDPLKSGIILDIDVCAAVNLSAEDARIYEIFGVLREIKNQVFFSSISERTKELFQ